MIRIIILLFLLFTTNNKHFQEVTIELFIMLFKSRIDDYLKKYLEQFLEEEDVKTFLLFLSFLTWILF